VISLANIRGILLDIEGTTSSVSFVYDVMFPFVRERMTTADLVNYWSQPEFKAPLEQLARDAGHASLATWMAVHGLSQADALHASVIVRDEVLRLMEADAKTTGLKALQGLVWKSGFESGELLAHVYEDVPPALAAWNASGKDVRIYSSGSVQAQKLFFGHTTAGNLLGHFRDHYDTTTGPKKEAKSYSKIATGFGLAPPEILFLSDIAAELDAARAAGMQTALCMRPGNATQPVSNPPHPQIASFAEIALAVDT
jgi:enolase-phosphatase E1